MSFTEHLAAFRAAHPEIEVAEVYVSDLNGVARGKLVPAEMLEKLMEAGEDAAPEFSKPSVAWLADVDGIS